MTLAKVHETISIKNFLKLLFAFAVLLQLSVITYSHLNGFYIVSDISDFSRRFLQGTLLSIIGLFLVAYPDLLIIRRLEKSYPLGKHPVQRIVYQFLLTLIVAVSAAILITLISHMVSRYREELVSILLINSLIFSVCNILLMVIFEAWIYYVESTETKRITQDLEKELSQIRFQVLKNQINPHFLFNSLNVLSGLIEKDPDKALNFIDEFSRIYRYVLETIEKPLVTLQEEITFIRSYMYLQQLRYGESLMLDMDLPSSCLEKYLPPLSLQSILENVIKHNLISPENPLCINISAENSSLIITNNIQPKMTTHKHTGLGQRNLVKRYKMVSDFIPEFQLSTDQYIVTLPLISGEPYEYSDRRR